MTPWIKNGLWREKLPVAEQPQLGYIYGKATLAFGVVPVLLTARVNGVKMRPRITWVPETDTEQVLNCPSMESYIMLTVEAARELAAQLRERLDNPEPVVTPSADALDAAWHTALVKAMQDGGIVAAGVPMEDAQ